MRYLKILSRGFGLFFLCSCAYSQNIIINEVMSANKNSLHDFAADTPDWIELFNDSDSLIQLQGLALTDDAAQPQKWLFPAYVLPPRAYLIVFASGKDRAVITETDSNGSDQLELHTSFKISAAGESVYLFSKKLQLLDSLAVPALASDQSFGRWPDPVTNLIFTEATPGQVNSLSSGKKLLPAPQFKLVAGFYAAPFQLLITHPETSVTLRFTDDGSPPGDSSNLYSGALQIEQTTVIRVRAFLADSFTSSIVTSTYFIGEETQLPVVSLATDRENFYGWHRGIYIKGPNADTQEPFYGANFWQDWERPLHVELFENDGVRAFAVDAGVKIFGNYSRSYPMKSLSIFARKKYGTGKIKYPIFPDKDINSYESFLLRNAGNDWKKAYMRDAVMHELMKNTDMNRQAYRPAIVFLNGDYLGIHNIREKINKHYLAENYGVNPDSIDLLADNHEAQEGSDTDYIEMINFIKHNDLQFDNNYDYITTLMDVKNYARYNAIEIYSANSDWPMVNVKYWRRQNGGKWRWLLFDLDSGLSSYGTSQPYSNTLRRAIIANALFPWSTTLFKNMIRSPRFRNIFFTSMADYLNSIFLPQHVDSVITRLQQGLEGDIRRHKYDWFASAVDWWGEVSKIRSFAWERPAHVRKHIIDWFGLPGEFQLTVEQENPIAGQIGINSLTLNQTAWMGIYFADVPVTVKATAKP